ncbi:hypothetical protein DAEQUDRAFT_731673 [Daedalea quercina L-15889]|uniref:Uncharacterized protein n=1 Tax=Daedalea quercina L-15889 TaxID=1314783 RepID=A0A165M614_9APHY|nr:hypothetical protein DAEQUDRAFT_731673 [Daedalea quercina L-15889]
MRFSAVLALVLATVSAAPVFAYYAEYDARDLADELYARSEGLKESSSYNHFRNKNPVAAAGHHGTEQGHEHEQGHGHEHAGELKQSSSYNHFRNQRPDAEHKRSVADFELTTRAIEDVLGDVLARAYIDPATGKVKVVVDNGYRNGATRHKGSGTAHEGSGSGRKGTGSGRKGTGAVPGKRALAELYGEW